MRIGLFDRMLYEGHGVLTSRGIQRSFVPALKKRRVRSVIADYWLLGADESVGLVFIPKNRWVTSICVMQMPICGLRMTHRIG